MKSVLAAFFLVYTAFFSAAAAEAFEVSVTPSLLRQGDTAIVKFLNLAAVPKSAAFDGQQVPSFIYQGTLRVLVPISAVKSPGAYPLRVEFKDGNVFEKKLTIYARRFPKLVLGIPEKLNLTPQGLTAKLQETKQTLDETLDVKTPEIFFWSGFGLPLKDNRKLSSVFGEIRKTGDQEIRHYGIDIASPLGTKIGAINGGVVRKTGVDPVYGNMVIVDHGQGIFSMYLHLDKILVKEGAALKKGALLGTVGQTGYSTMPHLHLSLKIGNISVDPLRFVNYFK